VGNEYFYFFCGVVCGVYAKLALEFFVSGLALDNDNLKWTKVICNNLKKLKPIESYCYKLNKTVKNKCFLLTIKKTDYVVVFMESWMWHIYEGKTYEEIEHKYDLGGHSNKASHLNIYEKWIGRKIENWYLSKGVNSV
jgi:hypothetical protein